MLVSTSKKKLYMAKRSKINLADIKSNEKHSVKSVNVNP